MPNHQNILPHGFPDLHIAGRTIKISNNREFRVEGRPPEAEPLDSRGVYNLRALNALPTPDDKTEGWVTARDWGLRIDGTHKGEDAADKWKERIEKILWVKAGEVIERKDGRYRLKERLIRIERRALADAPGIEVQVVERVSGPETIHRLYVPARESVATLADRMAQRLSLGLQMTFAVITLRTVVQLYKEATLLAEDALVINQGVQNGDRLYAELDVQIETRGGARGHGHVYRAEEDPDEDLRQELLAELRARFATPGFLDD